MRAFILSAISILLMSHAQAQLVNIDAPATRVLAGLKTCPPSGTNQLVPLRSNGRVEFLIEVPSGSHVFLGSSNVTTTTGLQLDGPLVREIDTSTAIYCVGSGLVNITYMEIY